MSNYSKSTCCRVYLQQVPREKPRKIEGVHIALENEPSNQVHEEGQEQDGQEAVACRRKFDPQSPHGARVF